MNVIEWLLDSDPAIRWQVMRDLTDAPPDEVAAERARVTQDELLLDLGERQGEPSRWITLRAFRVLRWAETAGQPKTASAALA